MYQLQTILLNLSLCIAAIVCIYDSIILFIRGKNNRPRQMLGITTLTWGIMYAFTTLASHSHQLSFPLLCGESLFSSHIFICLMFLFPLEVLLPGWLKPKRIFLMLVPIMCLAFVYFLGLKFTGQHIEEFTSFSEMLHSFGKFNVWFRVILLIWNYAFLMLLLRLLNLNEKRYLKWQNENYSDLDNIDISWLTFYKKMMIVILICYSFVAIWGSSWTIIIHTVVVAIGFSILFYKALFYESPYSTDFTESVMMTENAKESAKDISETGTKIYDSNNKEISDMPLPEPYIDNSSFKTQMPIYMERLKKWMEEEKPYLYKDFKLQDVSRVLPLNRSYLSRLFNEGYHQNFSEVVRNYRIQYAKELLLSQKSYPIYQIAEICGFSSVSTFNRAFQSVVSMSPKQYQMQYLQSKNNNE